MGLCDVCNMLLCVHGPVRFVEQVSCCYKCHDSHGRSKCVCVCLCIFLHAVAPSAVLAPVPAPAPALAPAAAAAAVPVLAFKEVRESSSSAPRTIRSARATAPKESVSSASKVRCVAVCCGC